MCPKGGYKIETQFYYGKPLVYTDSAGVQHITLEDLHSLDERHTLALVIARVSNEIHEACASLREPGDELYITIERRVSPQRELDFLSDELLGVSEDEEEEVYKEKALLCL